MKQRIKLTESDLHRIVKESIKRVLNEDETNEVEDAIIYLSKEFTEKVLEIKWGNDNSTNDNYEYDRKILMKLFYDAIHQVM